MLDIPEFVRLVVDPIRLAVLGAAAVGEVDAAAIAQATGVSLRRVQREVGALIQAGLLVAGRLDTSALQRLAAELPRIPEAAPAVIAGPWSADEARVLGPSSPVIGSRRSRLPRASGGWSWSGSPWSSNQACDIRSGKSISLSRCSTDFAALRRYLVDEGIMTRADGVYWRTGGRYRDDP